MRDGIIAVVLIVIVGTLALIGCLKIVAEDALFDRADVRWFRRKKRVPTPKSTPNNTANRQDLSVKNL